MTERVYISGRLTPGAKEAEIRQAVASGLCVVVVDDANVPTQITQSILQRHDANKKKNNPD